MIKLKPTIVINESNVDVKSDTGIRGPMEVVTAEMPVLSYGLGGLLGDIIIRGLEEMGIENNSMFLEAIKKLCINQYIDGLNQSLFKGNENAKVVMVDKENMEHVMEEHPEHAEAIKEFFEKHPDKEEK